MEPAESDNQLSPTTVNDHSPLPTAGAKKSLTTSRAKVLPTAASIIDIDASSEAWFRKYLIIGLSQLHRSQERFLHQ